MKIIFFGSDDFALVSLKALAKSKHKLIGCVTQPDRPKGRHLKIEDSALKMEALKQKAEVLQPADLKDPAVVYAIKCFKADLFVVIAYGKILPPEIIKLPKKFCVNIHASLLPKYRGAAPINWAIIGGEEVTGVTAIKVNAKMDAGEVIAQKGTDIDRDDNAQTLRERLAELGSELLLETLDAIEEENFTLTKQDEEEVTFAPKLTKEDGLIDWGKSAREVHLMVRGLVPWPSAYTLFNKKILKILEAKVLHDPSASGRPGVVLQTDKEGFTVGTNDGALLIKRVHLESSKPMDAASFLIGHPLEPGFKFG